MLRLAAKLVSFVGRREQDEEIPDIWRQEQISVLYTWNYLLHYAAKQRKVESSAFALWTAQKVSMTVFLLSFANVS